MPVALRSILGNGVDLPQPLADEPTDRLAPPSSTCHMRQQALVFGLPDIAGLETALQASLVCEML